MRFFTYSISCLVLAVSLAGCQPATPEPGGETFTGPSVHAGPVTISAYYNSEGEVEVSGTYAQTLIGNEYLGVTWDVGYQVTINEAKNKTFTLFILYQNNDEDIVRQEYKIDRPFEIRFTNEQWVKEIYHDGNRNIIVYVEQTEEEAGLPQPELTPAMFDFQVCADPCNGSNGARTFSPTTNLYLSWKYENIPADAHFVRYWTHETKGLWMTYDCTWDRSSAGQVSTRFYDNGGLAAGRWTVTMEVNDEIVLTEQLVIQGNEQYWDPWPPVYRCFDA